MKNTLIGLYLFIALSLSAENNAVPVAHWTFNDIKGNTVQDSSPNAVHGQLYGAKPVEGLAGTALEFSNGAHILVPWKKAMSGLKQMTVVAWLNLREINDLENQEIADAGYSAGQWLYILRVTPIPSVFRFQIKNSDGGYSCINGNTPIQIGKWYHIAAVSDGKDLRLYVNGVLDAAPVPCSQITVDKQYDMLIGRTFKGKLDDLRIYNTALSEKEIQEDYAVFEKTLSKHERNALLVAESGWIADKNYKIPAAWDVRKFMDKDFWMLLEKWKWEIPGVDDNAFISDAGCARIPIERLKESYTCFIREISFEDEGGNIAGYTVKKENPSSWNFKNIANISDNDNESFASRIIPTDAAFQQGKIIFEFKQPTEIAKIKLLQGYKTGISGQAPIYTMSAFQFQYWNGNAWQDIKEASCIDNRDSENIFNFPGIKTSRVRLIVNGGYSEDYKKYCDKDKPYFFGDSFIRIHGGGMDKRSEEEKRVLKEKYEKFLALNKEGCMGFWIGEWANDINWAPYRHIKNLPSLVEFAYGKNSDGSPACGFPLPPDTPEKSLMLLEKIYKYKRSILLDDAFGLNCAFPFDHYNLEWGGNMPSIEVTVCGEGRSRYNLQTAFCRGAARQYGKPWMHYDAYFYLSGNPDYINHIPLKKASNPSGPDFGIPVSLGRRSMLHAYYGGATFFDFESQPYAFVQDLNMDGFYELSPHGKVLEQFYEHAKKYPERGSSYTPVVLLLDYYHGWTPSISDKIWFSLSFDKGSYMIQEFMKTIWEYQTLFPKAKEQSGNSAGLVNTRYGDIFDVMLLNPPSGTLPLKTLSAYKAAIVLGTQHFSDDSAKALREYVTGGGTLLLNIEQVGGFFAQDFLGAEIIRKPDSTAEIKLTTAVPLITQNGKVLVSKNKYGSGYLILSSPAYLLDESGTKAHPVVAEILSHIAKEVLPVMIEGDIGYQLNIIDPDTWLLILMNNKGVIKGCFTPEEFDENKTAFVNVKFRKKPLKISELKDELSPVINENMESMTVKVPPGDVRIYKIEF